MDPSAISGQRTRSTHKVRKLAAVLGIAALTLSGLVAATGPAGALTAVGATDPVTSFPASYTDDSGLSLGMCLGSNCLAAAGSLTAPDGEAFYYYASASVGGFDAFWAVEAAFLDADPITFQRIQYQSSPGVDLVVGETYHITDPYGEQVCVGSTIRTRCRFETGGAVGNFASALTGRISNFLTATAGTPPSGFLGDTISESTVTGSPTGFNKFRVEAPSITSSCGVIPNCAETDLFALQGKIAVGPAARTNVSSLDFGNSATPVNRSAIYTSIGLQNAGITAAESNDPAFTVTPGPTCGSVNSGDNCQIGVTYTPVPGESSTGTVTITDNTPASPRTVSVSGSSLPVAAVTGPLSFGSRKVVDGASPAKMVTVSNTGVFPMTVSGTTSTSPDFSATGCVASVPAGSSCDLSVRFNPSSASNKSSTLTVNSNGGARNVALSGTGTKAVLGAPAGLSFGNTAMGRAKQVVLSVTNTGDAGMVVGTPRITGLNAGDYRMNGTTANLCVAGKTVEAGASCEIGVTFSPKALGSRAATLRVFGDDQSSTVSLRGAGVDRVKPTLLVKSPAAGATGVAVGASVGVSFSEAVKGVNRSTFMLTNQSNGLATRAVISGRAGNRWLLNPRANLSPGTLYVVRLVGGTVAIRDVSNNGLRSTTWSFRTR